MAGRRRSVSAIAKHRSPADVSSWRQTTSQATARPISPYTEGRTRRSMPIPQFIGRGGKARSSSPASPGVRRELDAGRARRNGHLHRRPLPMGRCGAGSEPAARALLQIRLCTRRGWTRPGDDGVGPLRLVFPRAPGRRRAARRHARTHPRIRRRPSVHDAFAALFRARRRNCWNGSADTGLGRGLAACGRPAAQNGKRVDLVPFRCDKFAIVTINLFSGCRIFKKNLQTVALLHRFVGEGRAPLAGTAPPLARRRRPSPVPVIPSRHQRVTAHTAPDQPPGRASFFFTIPMAW